MLEGNGDLRARAVSVIVWHVLTRICHACSCQEILRMETVLQVLHLIGTPHARS
eukprot:COSAG01_NODE_1494_length_10125_cov_93.590805_13_plen_54_part_00